MLHNPGSEIFVRHEQQVAVRRRCVDDFDGIAAGANHVAEGLNFRAAVDIGDGVEVRVSGLQGFELRGGAAFFERTAGVRIRQDHDLVRVENFRRFRHEMHAREDNHVRARPGRLL